MTDEQRSQTGRIGVPKCEVILARALSFRGGTFGALAPFTIFLLGVAWLGLSGAPNERGFWPILIAALATGLLFARDRSAYCQSVIQGMSHSLVALMVLAWLLAGVLGTLLQEAGFVSSLTWLAREMGLVGRGYLVATFLICCIVSMSTGTSLGTILVCGPLLYPAGSSLGTAAAPLAGAVLAGATFGDNLSPISDSTIASALTQGAPIGGVVRSRLKYALPAAALAVIGFVVLGGDAPVAGSPPESETALRSLWMALVPAVVLGLLLRGRHLLEGLITGIVVAIALGLVLGAIQPSRLLAIDRDNFIATGIILDGMERAIGVSISTLLLMGLVGPLEASGTLERVVRFTEQRITSARSAERWIVTAASIAVVLTTHSVVTLLAVGRFSRQTGEKFGVSAFRRANLLDVTVCTFPFLLPYTIPTILTAFTTATSEGSDMPRLTPFEIGPYNFYSWGLLILLAAALFAGYGRDKEIGRTI